MYSQNDINDAVAAGVISGEAADALTVGLADAPAGRITTSRAASA